MTDEIIEMARPEGGREPIEGDKRPKEKFLIKTTDEFNRCVDHIYDLLKSGYTLYREGIYSSSNLFSIAAIEEIVKVYNAIFSKDVDGYAGKGMGKRIFGPDYYLWMDDRLTDAVE